MQKNTLSKNRQAFYSQLESVEIRKDALLFSEYPFLRKLVWWK